jgi:hypothetical protein
VQPALTPGAAFRLIKPNELVILPRIENRVWHELITAERRHRQRNQINRSRVGGKQCLN